MSVRPAAGQYRNAGSPRASRPPRLRGEIASGKIGAVGFEPTTSSSQSWRSTRLSHAPIAQGRRQSRDFPSLGRKKPRRFQTLEKFSLNFPDLGKRRRAPSPVFQTGQGNDALPRLRLGPRQFGFALILRQRGAAGQQRETQRETPSPRGASKAAEHGEALSAGRRRPQRRRRAIVPHLQRLQGQQRDETHTGEDRQNGGNFRKGHGRPPAAERPFPTRPA